MKDPPITPYLWEELSSPLTPGAFTSMFWSTDGPISDPPLFISGTVRFFLTTNEPRVVVGGVPLDPVRTGLEDKIFAVGFLGLDQ